MDIMKCKIQCVNGYKNIICEKTSEEVMRCPWVKEMIRDMAEKYIEKVNGK